MRSSLVRWLLASVGGLALVCSCWLLPNVASQPPGKDQKPYQPKIFGPSAEGEKAIKRIRVPADCQVELWAAEPLLANPVAFSFDEKGRCFIAETFRLHAGATDNRNHMSWLADDLASRTVADRVAMYKKYLKDKFDTFAVEQDRVRMVWDSTGKGKADKATVFADGFNAPEAGIGSGVLARHGKVWYTCIPDLWLLEEGQQGKAGHKKLLSTGYGVHVAFLGHDLHGLRFGPDGKLYFSIGDRGFNVNTEGRRLVCPDSGAVLRCNPDGSNLEVVAIGLRNPQELAFDEYGNLFTCDNNADGGDQARWVNIVEYGDSGWRIGYQYLQKPMQLGAWNAEKLWGVPPVNQAAYLLPPLHHIASGPSGLTYNPGVTLLPTKYQKHFFLCDFRGGSGGSGIHAFRVEPKGAAFQLVGAHQFAWSILATDCDFGPDGGFYLSDWVDGWGKPNKGRIYKISDPKRLKDAQVAEVKRLLAEGMKQRGLKELVGLLEHADQRVRQEAQFALAERPSADVRALLLGVATRSKHQLARLHALWGLSQLNRKTGLPLTAALPFLKDPDPQVRAQAAKVIAEGKHLYYPGVELKPFPAVAPPEKRERLWEEAARALEAALKDDQPRVRLLAALSIAKIGSSSSEAALVGFARANADQDAYVRHGVVMGLAECATIEKLVALSKDESPAVRLVGLLALRRLQRVEVANWLGDREPRNVLEAARAINDVPIPAAFAELAKLPIGKGSADALVYRVLNANFRLGGKENAVRVANWAARPDVSEATRLEALTMLADWAKPSNLDRVVGLWRPLPQRDATLAHDALRGALAGVFTGSDKVRATAAKVAAASKVGEVGPVLLQLVKDAKALATARVESLRALAALKDTRLPEAIELALQADTGVLRAEGRRLLARREPARALGLLTEALNRGERIEQQEALATLAEMKRPEATKLLITWAKRLVAGEVPLALRLDVIEAIQASKSPELAKLLTAYDARRPKGDPLAAWKESQEGGNAAAGRRIFFEKAEVSCLRCHKLHGQGGDVGPDLSDVGAQHKRDYLLESIVDPNKQIAKGFETVVLTLSDGQIKTGIIKSETKKEVRLMNAEGQILTIPTEDIDQRSRGKSAMPEDIVRYLSRREVRDLVEFLAEQKRK